MTPRLLAPAATLAVAAFLIHDACTAYGSWLDVKLEGFAGGLVLFAGLLLIPIAWNGGK